MLPTLRLALVSIFIVSSTALRTASDELTFDTNLFAQDIYRFLSQIEDGNFLVSPFSAVIILAFVLSGSRGRSAQELSAALHLPPQGEKHVEAAIQPLLQTLKGDSFFTLHTANKMYLKKGFIVRKEFQNIGKHIYGAETETIDFASNTVEAARTINCWVERHTNRKIKDLVDFRDLDEGTKAVVINALYFNATWSKTFSNRHTRMETFYITPREVVEIEMMHLYSGSFSYFECSYLEAQILELPFKGDKASMMIVLPHAKDGLPFLENELDKIFSRKYHLKRKLINVALPKFTIETSSDLREVLVELGVTSIFRDETADLSGIAGNPGELYIDELDQKTFIDVWEDGVEAAAATADISNAPTAMYETKDFIADHPFLFYIKVDDIVIFAGRVTDPTWF